MSSQQHTDADSTIMALDAQLDDVIDELYNNDQQTGRFISTTQGHLPPMELFGSATTTTTTRNTTLSLPATPATARRQVRPTAAVAATVTSPISRRLAAYATGYENPIIMRRPVHERYRYKTYNSNNFVRIVFLPQFPSTDLTIQHVRTATTMPAKQGHLLLSNIPSNVL